MSSVEVQAQVSVDALLRGAAQLETSELESFVSQVLVLRAKRAALCLNAEESALLVKVNWTLPPLDQHRYDELRGKLEDETISDEEHQELLKMIDVMENADAERIRALAALAQRRGVTIDKVMEDLGIQPPGYD